MFGHSVVVTQITGRRDDARQLRNVLWLIFYNILSFSSILRKSMKSGDIKYYHMLFLYVHIYFLS